MVQISSEESATNGNRQESVTVSGLLATVHWQRMGAEITLQSIADAEEGEASPVQTRRSVAGDLEMESGLIGDGEWLIGDASTATLQWRMGFSFFVWVSLFF